MWHRCGGWRRSEGSAAPTGRGAAGLSPFGAVRASGDGCAEAFSDTAWAAVAVELATDLLLKNDLLRRHGIEAALVLPRAGLLTARRHGRHVHYALDHTRIATLGTDLLSALLR
nr:helix-turn-helix domain-containing protein [Streptomyces sp. adm13(2018)]